MDAATLIQDSKTSAKFATIPLGIAALVVFFRWVSCGFAPDVIENSQQAVPDQWLFVVVFFICSAAVFIVRLLRSDFKKLNRRIEQTEQLLRRGAINEADYRESLIVGLAGYISGPEVASPNIESVEMLSNLVNTALENNESETKVVARKTVIDYLDKTLRKNIVSIANRKVSNAVESEVAKQVPNAVKSEVTEQVLIAVGTENAIVTTEVSTGQETSPVNNGARKRPK